MMAASNDLMSAVVRRRAQALNDTSPELNQTRNQTNKSDAVARAPAELIYAVTQWGTLPEAIRVAVVALIRAVSSY